MHTGKKKLLSVSLILSIVVAVATLYIAPISAISTQVFVDPPSIVDPTLTPPDIFTVNVKVSNVTNLYGYEFKLFYDTTILNGTSVVLPPGHFLTPANPSNIFVVKREINDNFNATHGRVWVAATLLTPELPKSGSGIFATVTFVVTGLGSSILDLRDTKLSDATPAPISHTAVDGYFNNLSPATLLVNPPSIINPALIPGTNFTIDINIGNVRSLYRFHFKLGYNTTVLNATTVEEGPFLEGFGTTVINVMEINDTIGVVSVDIMLQSPAPPASGNGTLATISFNVTEFGESVLDLYDTQLLDRNGLPLDHNAFDGYFNNILLAKIFVDPPSMVFTTLIPPTIVAFNISVDDVKDMYDFQFKLGYDTAMLNGLGAVVIPHGNETHFIVKLEIDDEAGLMWVNVTYYPPALPITSMSPMTLVTVYFQVATFGESVLDLFDTNLSDPLGGSIPHVAVDGRISVLRHDVAIVSVVPSVARTYVGRTVRLNVTARNVGDLPETFNVTAYYDNATIGMQTVTNLAAGADIILTFNWDTTGVQPCHNYTISAIASVVSFEINTANNVYIDSKVKVKMLGDINGDGIIDIFDVNAVAVAMGTRPGDPGWNPEADLFEDGTIDIFDLVIVGQHFGETC